MATNYGFVKSVDCDIATAEQRVRDALEKQGFGVLVKIDMAAKLREKLGVTMDDYVILGACNPPNAFKAVTAEPDIGLLLPCNVVVYLRDGKTFVGIIKPTEAMSMVENPGLQSVAVEVEAKLKAAFDAV